MTTLDPRPLLPSFLPSLNALLAALALPFTLNHPTDLTPSLLLAIFESLIGARLPIPVSVRQSRTQDAKVRAMLVLLGVLECDILRGGTATDAEHSIATSNADNSVLGGAGGVSVDGWVDEIGLGDVDPERLADGGWEETIFVGELLCWLARRKGILPRTKPSRRSAHPRSLYSNHHSYGTEGEGETVDLSTSLLLRPSSTQKLQSPRRPSPSPSIDNMDAVTDADSSVLSHITDVPRHPLVHSPEHSLSVSATTGTDLSIRARSVSSRTSMSDLRDNPDNFGEASQDTVQIYDPYQMIMDAEDDDDRPPTFRPQCIHELEDPSYIRALAGPSLSFDPSASHDHLFEAEHSSREDDDEADAQQDNDDLYAPPTPTPQRVRLAGWIEPVDAAIELGHFAASRSRSRAFDTTAGLGSGPPSQPQPHKHTRSCELPGPTSRLERELSPRPRMSRHMLPLPSPSSLPLPMSSKHPPTRSPPSPPLSPPSPTHSDSPFDVSFSTFNNTSTPAKPRPPPRTQGRVLTETRTGSGRPRRRDRSPSYTPSPPSFSTPRSLRSGVTSVGTSDSKPDFTRPSGAKTRMGASAIPSSAPPATTRKKELVKTSPELMSIKGKSPPPVAPLSSTAMTNTLLTERARLLTELAVLKRARAASSAGKGSNVVSVVGTAAGGGSNGVVSRRVGVGI